VSSKLKQLSGSEVKSILQSFGFKVHSQRGSHVKLRRELSAGKQTLTIPLHNELDIGTLKAIIRQASRFIPENQLYPHFYTD